MPQVPQARFSFVSIGAAYLLSPLRAISHTSRRSTVQDEVDFRQNLDRTGRSSGTGNSYHCVAQAQLPRSESRDA
jgi:hypothetical protein